MDTAIAFRLLERGEARCVCASVLIVRVGERFYISFDGRQWEETDSDLVKGQV